MSERRGYREGLQSEAPEIMPPGDAEIDYEQFDEYEDLKTEEAPAPEQAEARLWAKLEQDMTDIERYMRAQWSARQPLTSKVLMNNRDILSDSLEKYMTTVGQHSNPIADKNIDHVRDFITKLNLIIAKTTLQEEAKARNDETLVAAPRRPAKSAKPKTRPQPINTGSSLMSEAIRGGYKPLSIPETFKNFVKKLFGQPPSK